jgi:TonB family protein
MILRLACLGCLLLGAAAGAQAQVTNLEHFEAPAYPPLARQVQISGTVTLELDLAADGSVKAITARESPHPLLLQHAKAAVEKWKFNTETRERKATVSIHYDFTGETRDDNPRTTVKADFLGSLVRVIVTTDGVTTRHP